ncbi:uncharacterized protein SAPINGB_P002944 [Magnusiomyces paraingens]|uniref:Uncharacterized protein n=1 Tax=Magnusiomyces paraingens TaxID=2606893 RepID=A0A5E8BHF1_9ASCO|nr:uncharacterized protein SAPINGB_P002944 [Saprochaete ingens]VVT50980.1 unnamed protein product [Saprochaete ingens]
MLTVFQKSDKLQIKRRRLGPGPSSPIESSLADSHSDSEPEDDNQEWEKVNLGFNCQSMNSIKIADYEGLNEFDGQEQLREVPLFTQGTAAEWYDSMVGAHISNPMDSKVSEMAGSLKKTYENTKAPEIKNTTVHKLFS